MNLSELLRHLDYVLVAIVAIVLYRWYGRPLANVL